MCDLDLMFDVSEWDGERHMHMGIDKEIYTKYFIANNSNSWINIDQQQ